MTGKFLATIALTLLSMAAHADTALTVHWLNATLNVDGTPATLLNTELQWGICSATLTFPASPYGSVVVPFPGIDAGLTPLPDGVWCLRARHNSTTGTVSAWSTLVTKTLTTIYPKPAKPTSVTVTIP